MTIDSEILSALRKAGDTGVSGADLATKLGMTRAAIWARIEELRVLGYDIEASPHHGYQLRASPDLLHADDLIARLGDRPRVVGRDIRVFQETTSTNDIVEKLARDGVKEGVAVFAESQTKGRGRLGRKWHSLSGKGLWFSVLLRPPLRPPAATQITVAAATALCLAIEGVTGLSPTIKWPNDIFIKGRKVAGILTELSAELDQINHMVLGIGVDVNLAASDFPADLRKLATSIRIELGSPVNRAELATIVLRELDRAYGTVCRGGFARLAEDWQSRCKTLGSSVRITIGERTVVGVAEALDDDGALLLRTQHGRLERITGGDVTLEK